MPRLVLCAGVVLAIACPAAAETRWTLVRTPGLTVIGDQSGSTLRDVAIQLEQFRAVVAGLIAGANRPPSLPTNVFVFGTRSALRPYLPLTAGKPAALAGYFQRDGDVNTIAMSLERMDESSAVAYHEYTHLLVGNAVRSIPVWLNEGLAEYYSTYRLLDGGREAQIGRPPEGRLALLRETTLPLADVINVDHSSALYNESHKRSIFYAESWAMTHYILTQMPNGGEAINTYAGALAEGRTPYEAFFAAFGQTPADFDRILRVYVQRTLFGGTKFTFPDKIAAPETSAPRTLSATEANAWLGDLQRRMSRDTEATPRIDAAAAADPDSAITHLAAGLLRFGQDRTNEGLLEMDRAAALAPDDFLTQYLHGVWLLRSDLVGSATHSDAAIQALNRAAALRPESSDVYAWLAYAQLQNEATLADARRSIERAIELAPGRADHRLRWADVRMLQGGYDDARTLLTQIAAIRNDPRSAEGAQQRLDRLQEFERRAESRREEAAAQAARRRSFDVPPDAPAIPDDQIRLQLRRTRAGEQRVAGNLTGIDCSEQGVRFRVESSGQTIITKLAPLDAVEMISYLPVKEFGLSCGPRAERDSVYLTTRDGTAVAIEFLPKGFVP